MVKQLICFALLAMVLARAATLSGRNYVSATDKEFVPIVKSTGERQSDGSFIFSYEGGDGSYREEVGLVKNAGTDDEALEVSGTYRYYDADGQLVEVTYTANKDGFVPHGTNIPLAISQAAQAAADAAHNESAKAN